MTVRVALLVSHAPGEALALARAWVAAGDTVTAVLLDAAAGAARAGHPQASALAGALADGVELLVHDDALRRRALDPAAITDGVKIAGIDEIADLVADGADKAVWL